MYSKLISIYPMNMDNIGFVCSTIIVFFSFLNLFLNILCLIIPLRILGSVLIVLSILVSQASEKFGLTVDTVMIENLVQTDANEAGDLLAFSLFLRFLIFGLPALIFLWGIGIKKSNWKEELFRKLKYSLVSLVLIFTPVLVFSKHYASFFREHKDIREYANPVFPIYSLVKYTKRKLKSDKNREFKTIATFAKVAEHDQDREVVVLVVGETARSDHFSLNGYKKITNPRLQLEKNLISFKDVKSCGTSTATSVPCMFSTKRQNEFDLYNFRNEENILDILKRAGVSIVWLDNNSDSKGVADRIEYIDYKNPDINPVCDTECRDLGMLGGIKDYIDTHEGDLLIIVHQMGSHGPAYYQRYPEEFEYFQPACHTLELSKCTKVEIENAYDNTILYTDYFLSEIIQLLKKYDQDRNETTMVYISDHGESLGESGIYLHGMPYRFSPNAQTHVPMIIWNGDLTDIDTEATRVEHSERNLSHDQLSYSLLKLFELDSDIIYKENDTFISTIEGH